MNVNRFMAMTSVVVQEARHETWSCDTKEILEFWSRSYPNQ